MAWEMLICGVCRCRRRRGCEVDCAMEKTGWVEDCLRERGGRREVSRVTSWSGLEQVAA